MNTYEDLQVSAAVYVCGRCTMMYDNYKHLVQHLFWRHGTESFSCNECCLKRWQYAAHHCHVLPVDDEDLAPACEEPEDSSARESEFCSCGKAVADAPMIGCDGPKCVLQWYHFACVGIVEPPDGDWLCPACTQLHAAQKNKRYGG